MNPIAFACAALLLACIACGQRAPNAWQTVPLAQARGVAVVVEMAVGLDADPAALRGLAQVHAGLRLLQAKAAVPEVHDANVTVLGDVVRFFAFAEHADEAVRFATAVHSPLRCSDAELLAAAAKAALAADDAQWLLPGCVLESWARQQWFSGAGARPVAGDALALHAASAATLRAALPQQVGVAAGLFGDLSACPPLAALPQGWQEVALVRAPQPSAELQVRKHERVLAPFVALAYPAPQLSQAFSLAMAVGKARAGKLLPLRGSEAAARAPLVAWTWQQAQPVVLFLRRGANGASVQQTQRELELLQADLRRPITAGEFAAAVASLRMETGEGPIPVGSGDAGLLTYALARTAASHRWPQAEAWDQVPLAAVQASLHALQAEPHCWLALEP